jgi:hypothetical protein
MGKNTASLYNQIKMSGIFGILLMGACATPTRHREPIAVPVNYVGHAMRVPVIVNGKVSTHFIFDTGIGVTVLLKRFAEKLNLKTDGQFTGKRMSGQAVTVPLTNLGSIEVAGENLKDPRVGIIELDLPTSYNNVEGFFGLRQFENTPVTLDYKNNRLIVETPESLANRLAKGTVIPIEFDVDGPGLVIFAKLSLPNGKLIRVEIDTGSDDLILDERFMADLGFKPGSPGITTKTGKDETGHTYARYFGNIKGSVHLDSASNAEQIDPKVMFQKIIYDGLIGYDYFKNFVVTYDLPNKRLIIAP